jgi:hypothetical protein
MIGVCIVDEGQNSGGVDFVSALVAKMAQLGVVVPINHVLPDRLETARLR